MCYSKLGRRLYKTFFKAPISGVFWIKGKQMAYQAIYRKWRPNVFEDIVGQSHITETLKNQIITGKIGHAYLFCGTRGTGKTTAAKVFAKAVNCMNNQSGSPCNECEICRGISDGSIMDVTEIDAASNNGVDNIREIREDTKYVAAAAKYRIYIIDEVHMLSQGAFNALLKTLEEPPEHVIFILATTEAHKVPQTILSRCQRFDFKRIKPSDIILRLKEIAYNDGIKISEDGFALLARLGDGSMRDALSVTERVIATANGAEITQKTITDILGIAPLDTEFLMADAIIAANTEKIFEIIAGVVDDGRDLHVFVDSVIKHFRDLLVCKLSDKPEMLLDYSAEDIQKFKAQANKTSFEKISSVIHELTSVKAEAKWVKAPRIMYELGFIKLCVPELDNTEEALISRISAVEEKIKEGISVVSAAPAVQVEKEEEEPKKKQIVSKKLYNPIPESELHSENVIVKAAKKWDKIAQIITKNMPHLMAALANRQITVDADGIILLFDKNTEELSKTIADANKSVIEQIFIKASGISCRVKTAFMQDVEDVLVDYWNLKTPKGTETDNENNSVEIGEDPLDSLMARMPEIIESADDTAFLDYNSKEDSFEQSSLEENEKGEEFLDEKEKASQEAEENED